MNIELEVYEHSGQVLAALFVCTILARIIYSKGKYHNNTAVDNDILNKVGYKVEDLELKVNVLTYKLQYGAWPLPHQVQKSNFKKNLRNLRLTLSNPNDRNNWIKHVLLRINPVFNNITNRKYRESLRSDNLEVQNRNAISLPQFSKRKNNKSARKMKKESKHAETKQMTGACKEFAKTMDDCKQYLKQLHDSNKNLGLVCSSSEISDGSSIRSIWSDAQQEGCIQQKDLTKLSQNFKENESDKQENTKNKEIVEKTNNKQENNHDCFQLTNTIYPVMKMIDKRLLPPGRNIAFSSDVFPRQSTSNMLISKLCEQNKYIKTSQEALYQVKKKLESLHNVLRMYELQNIEPKTLEKQQKKNNNINSVCQNVVDTLVSVTTETDSMNKNRRNKVNFSAGTRNSYNRIQRITSNSSEQYESDESGKSSMVSIQSYSNIFNTCSISDINNPCCSITEKSKSKISLSNNHELEVLKNNRTVYPSNITYERIPERIYYTISSDSSKGKDVNKKLTLAENFTSLTNIYVEDDPEKSFSYSDEYQVPRETDEDGIISPTSSRTEASKESEFDDKSTALLLQEALQFKKALLTRVELEKICYIDDQGKEINNQSVSDYGTYSYVTNNLQSKFLDIISEEQSVSSSTERTSKTYMYFNLKQCKQFNNNLLTQQNEIKNSNVHKEYFDSKSNLDSPSEYFSLSNILQEENEINERPLSKQNHYRENESPKVIPSNLQIKYLNNTVDKSDEKLMELKFTSCLNSTEINTNEEEICYNEIHEKESFKEHFMRMNSINEFINRNINSVELFSQNLDECLLEEEIENSNASVAPKTLNSISLKQYADVSCTKNTEDDMLNANLNVSDDGKYIEDREILTCNPNLTLKRNPGACSLIEQTLITTDIEKMSETHYMAEDQIYESSLSESKETSLETNLMQDSLASSINHSNDSIIPEPPSATLLVNKSIDEKRLNINWSNINKEFSDDCMIEKDAKTFSTNTITLQQYNTTNTDNYETEIHCNENDKPKDRTNNSVAENSFASLGKEELINKVDFYKSYSNLISSHSSMYFTDEGLSSTTKLHSTHSKHFGNYSNSNLYTEEDKEDKLHYKDKNAKNIGNTETLSIPTSGENDEINVITTTNTNQFSINASSNLYDITQKLRDFTNKTSDKIEPFCSKNDVKNTDILSTNETKSSRKENEILYNKYPASYNDNSNYNFQLVKSVTSDKAQPILPINSTKKLNIEQSTIPSNTSLHQFSTNEIKNNKIIKRSNESEKSESNEIYTLKSKKLEKPIVKNLKSDLLHTTQTEVENRQKTYTKLKDLSTEPGHNKETNIKLDKKRSRSQISFRTDELQKQLTLQSRESPSNTNFVNYTESFENKLKLKDHLKPLSPTPKISSRSCIPILKSRLEAARRSENETRPKSPVRGPLTMTMFWKDNLCDKNQDIMEKIQVEGTAKNCDTHVEEINRCVEKRNDDDNEQMVIYVNIFTKYDHNTTKIVDPNKFLEYIKNRKISIQKMEENQANEKNEELQEVFAENEKNTMRKIVTVVSSILNNNDELDQSTSTSLSALKTQNDPLTNVLLNDKLKNLCFLSVEQREIDVTAKPSVIDTSTSISDLENVLRTSKSTLNKFQICGTPKELNNEEYIALLDILHQEPNFIHLQELQNVCRKLVSEY
ncbi:hypothetical protein WH47_10083 [Habropoda laboriosa]|uniref:Uncharacterized protein n=1 Tax=Habropoda laboriosa TaxID=597456 RepID=A0A0L7R3T0_9HYME|nr:hypothetical protein WH47_10083 [Habropoda laboriosa]